MGRFLTTLCSPRRRRLKWLHIPCACDRKGRDPYYFVQPTPQAIKMAAHPVRLRQERERSLLLCAAHAAGD